MRRVPTTLVFLLAAAVAVCTPLTAGAQRSSSEPFKWSGDVQSGSSVMPSPCGSTRKAITAP